MVIELARRSIRALLPTAAAIAASAVLTLDAKPGGYVVVEKPVAPVTTTYNVKLEWSDVQRTQTCWFFSGPAEVGARDHRYGTAAVGTERDHALTLSFGDNEEFTGTTDDNGNILLLRLSTGMGY